MKKIEGATAVCQMTKTTLKEYCIEHGSHPGRTQADTILPFYAGSVTHEIKAGLFARKVVLVEGLTESLSIPMYLKKAGLDVTKEGIAVIPVMGKGNLAKWWRFFTAYGVPTYITFDNDEEDDDQGKKRRDILKAISLSEAESDQLLEEDSWNVAISQCIFGVDFEETMRESFSGYGELEDEAKEVLGDSKPLVARYVAERLPKDDTQVGWQRWAELAGAVRDLTIPE